MLGNHAFGAAFALAQKKQIRPELESGGNLSDHIKGGLGGAGFAAAQQNRMNAYPFDRRLLAQRRQALWKCRGGNGWTHVTSVV